MSLVGFMVNTGGRRKNMWVNLGGSAATLFAS